MFGLFKRKKQPIVLSDLDGNILIDGDKVLALRYDLGECLFINEEDSFFYESIESKNRVSYLKMIDASTDRQKVKKILEE